jgi:hypothetical protein
MAVYPVYFSQISIEYKVKHVTLTRRQNRSLPALLLHRLRRLRGGSPKRALPLRQLLSRYRVLPDFLIIGTQKGGTSSLYDYLGQHPQVRAALLKEPHYFSRWHKKGENWYRAHFPLMYEMTSPQGKCITGEASPDYLLHPHAASLAHALLPDAKIFILLRNPITRAFSHYNHNAAKGRGTRSFEEAVRAEMEAEQPLNLAALEGRDYRRAVHELYMGRGFYADQLERWFACYSRDQIMIFQSEVFFAQPRESLDQALKFLELSAVDLDQIDYSPRLQGKYKAVIEPGLRAELADTFRPHNERLYALLGQRFDWE